MPRSCKYHAPVNFGTFIDANVCTSNQVRLAEWPSDQSLGTASWRVQCCLFCIAHLVLPVLRTIASSSSSSSPIASCSVVRILRRLNTLPLSLTFILNIAHTSIHWPRVPSSPRTCPLPKRRKIVFHCFAMSVPTPSQSQRGDTESGLMSTRSGYVLRKAYTLSTSLSPLSSGDKLISGGKPVGLLPVPV